MYGSLPLAEFTYNNAPSATMGILPFYANKGYHPNIMVYPEREIASQCAREYVVDLDELHAELCNQMSSVQSDIKYLQIAIGYPHPIFVLVKKSLLVLNTYALLGQPRNFLKNT